MSLFSEVKPVWDNVGVDPGGTKKTAGWLANEKPPAEWFNWLFNRNYKCIDELRTVVDAIAVASGAANVINYGTSSTGNDTYVITPNPAITGYAAGQVFEILVDVGNTGTASLNVSAKGAKTIKKLTAAGKVVLDTGDMIAGGNYILVCDGTDVILQNPTSILDGLAAGSDGQILKLASGLPVWSDKLSFARVNGGNSTSIAGSGELTETIALGINAKYVEVLLTPPSYLYWLRLIVTPINWYVMLGQAGSNTSAGASASDVPFNNPVSNDYVKLVSVSLSGTNLVLHFHNNWGSSTTYYANWQIVAIG